MTTPTQPRHLVRLHDLSADELNDLLDLSARLRARAGRGEQRPLEGRTVGLLFFRGSLRTRVSLESAVVALGGFPINLTATSDFWELEQQVGAVMDGRAPEHIQDAAAAISTYVDALAIRPALEGKPWAAERRDQGIRGWAKHATVPVINMESALWHPLQALADLMTLRDHLGSLPGKRIAIQWVHSPAPTTPGPVHSLIASALRLGMDVSLGHPPGFDLDEHVLDDAREAGAAAGGSLTQHTDPRANVEGAEVVYARSWRSLDTWHEPTLAASRLARHEDWCITEELMSVGADARLMHAMPIRRNVEATDEVLDGPRSLLLAQAENRLHSQKALLTRLLRR